MRQVITPISISSVIVSIMFLPSQVTFATTNRDKIDNLSKNQLITSVEFSLPDDKNPNSSIGGGSRGNVQFGLPEDSSNPNSSVGGGSRGDIQFGLPENSSNPNSSVGGGSRGDVELTIPNEQSNPSVNVAPRLESSVLKAILPHTNNGRTTFTHPTIFVYLPPLGTQKVFFSLQDEDGNPHYHTMLRVPPQGGMIMVTLPPEVAPLVKDQYYLWYFAPIEAGGRLKPNNYAVTGWIKRVESNVNSQQLADSPVKLATEYGKIGVWYDTLKVLAEAKLAEPDNETYTMEWHDLLEQVDLEQLSDEPLVRLR